MSALNQRLKNFPFSIILGSASPRRQELLKGLGFEFTVQSINADESWPEELEAQEIPLYLSTHKSNEFPRILLQNELLITSDTIVWCDNKVFNKPSDFNEGRDMLLQLSGKSHEVYTGVTIRSAIKKISFCDYTKVFFKNLSEDEIAYYLEQYRPYDKAGAYGVQEWIGYVAIEKIEGSYHNVMGLPVKLVYEALLNF
jgi:septum formation protein